MIHWWFQILIQDNVPRNVKIDLSQYCIVKTKHVLISVQIKYMNFIPLLIQQQFQKTQFVLMNANHPIYSLNKIILWFVWPVVLQKDTKNIKIFGLKLMIRIAAVNVLMVSMLIQSFIVKNVIILVKLAMVKILIYVYHALIHQSY